jgi:hypothetical protein
LIFKCPYDVNEFSINTEILGCCVDNIIISNIELVNPYDISETITMDKKFIVFKEIFFVKIIYIKIKIN